MIIYYVVLISIFFQLSVKGNLVITPLYAIHLEASPFQLGIIFASTSLFPMILGIYAGKLSDNIGHKIPIILGSMGTCLSLLLPYIYSGNLWVLFLSQCLFGLAQIFFQVSIQDLIGKLSDKGNLSKNFGLLVMGNSIATLFGSLMTGLLIDYLGYSHTFLTLAIICMIPGSFFLFLKMQPNYVRLEVDDNSKRKYKKNSMMGLMKNKSLRFVLIVSCIILTSISLYNFYFPIYARDIGFTASMIGLVLSVNAAAFLFVRAVIPFLSKLISEEIILSIALIISSLMFITLPVFESYFAILLISFVLGLGLGAGAPLTIVMAFNRSPKGQTAEVLGIRLTVNKFAQFSVPIVFGMLGTVSNIYFIFWLNAFISFLGGYSLIKRRLFLRGK